MFTAASVAGGNIITNGLNAWFDFGDTQCYKSTGGGTIGAGTPFNNLAPGQSPTTGSVSGSVTWSSAFGGCMNLASANTSTLQYNAGFSSSFTVQTIVTPGTDSNANANWTNDGGGWPGYRATDGFVWAQQNGGLQTGNYLLPILYAGASAGTLPNGTIQPALGWAEYMRFPNVYTFKTNGSNSHSTYMNVGFKATDTTTRTRGNSAVGTIYLNWDSALNTRHGTGRIVAYLHYNRVLEDWEIFQNAQYYLNRFGIKS